jgi:transposase
MFADGVQKITPEIGFKCQDNKVTYFNGHLPIFTHDKDDIVLFRLITSTFIDQGLVTQPMISRTFGVPLRTVKRYLKVYREGGSRALYAPKEKRRGHKLTPERLVEVQEKLHQGVSVPEIAREMDILATTLHKAIDAGRLQKGKKKVKLRSPS